MTPLQKLPKNGEDWGKLIVAKGFKKLPKVQNIAQSGHTVADARATYEQNWNTFFRLLFGHFTEKCIHRTTPSDLTEKLLLISQ